MMESDEEGLLATNLIEELSGNDLGFHLRQGDKLLNNSQYFQITNLTKLHKLVHNDDNDDVTDDEDAVSPRLKFKVRRKSAASVVTMSSPRRRVSSGSVMSVVSNIGDLEAELSDMEEEEVLRLTVRSGTRRYSAISAVSSDGGLVTETLDIPIIVVTVPHDTEGEDGTKYGWSSKGYKNFKFRFKSKLMQTDFSVYIFLYLYYLRLNPYLHHIRLKKTLKERETLLEKRMESEKRGRRISVDSTTTEEKIQKRRLKKRRQLKSNLKRNRVDTLQGE